MKHNWEYTKLGHICSFERGVTYSKKDESEVETDNIILRSNNIDLETYSLNRFDLKYLKAEFNIKKEKRLRANSILICMSNGSLAHLGKTAFISSDSNMAFGGFMGLIIPKRENPKYISYFFRSKLYYEFLESLNRGANIRNIQFSRLSELKIPVPPERMQELIVAELDKINEIISDCKEVIRNLDSLAQSLFYDYFGDHLANSKGWEVDAIGNVCLVQTGATPGRENPDNFKGNIPWIKTTEVQNCEIRITEEHISEDALKNTNCKVFPIDTIIVAMYGQGKTRGQIAKLKIEACTNQACAAILPSRCLDSTFLYWFLFNSYDSLRNLAVGGNQKNLNLSIIKNYKIILPPVELQKKFATRIEQIEQQKKDLEETIANMQTLLESRMDYWFG